MSISPAPTQIAEVLPAQVAKNTARAQVILLSLTVFLGAFLLFFIEPLFAKMILPWFGGSAAVWGTCLVFFQCALLLGYVYAHLTSLWLTPGQRAFLPTALLLASLLFLPIAPHLSWRTQGAGEPAGRILGLLTVSIGLPFVLLSSTSPLVQTWYARRKLGAEPYHLFAWSNLASVLALLSFPLIVEPRIGLHTQGLLWSALFAIFAALSSLAAWSTRGATQALKSLRETHAFGSRLKIREVLLWLGLSACGAMLLLSITNHLLENVAPVLLLWVLPLGTYLLTFIVAFSRRKLYSPWALTGLFPIALGIIGYSVYAPAFLSSMQLGVPVFCIGLFVCCLFCHGQLAARRPAARHLTTFYLMISLGGAIGAIFVGLVAPNIFTSIYEFPLTLVLVALLTMTVQWNKGWTYRVFWGAASIALIAVLGRNVRSNQQDAIVRVRNFYAPLSVKRRSNPLNNEAYRSLFHGPTEHGVQYVAGPQRLLPTTYYGPPSGIGLALQRCCTGSKRVGVIGLGVGTLAAYGKSGDYFRFYEIIPRSLRLQRHSSLIFMTPRLNMRSSWATGVYPWSQRHRKNSTSWPLMLSLAMLFRSTC